MGTFKRIDGLRSVFDRAGAEVHEIKLRVDHRPSWPDMLHTDWRSILGGTAVPETLSWSAMSARRELDRLDPDVVLCCTSRAFHPVFLGGRWRVVLDFIDRLSVSYRDRTTVEPGRLRRIMLRTLARPNERFEERALRLDVTPIAAGWADALALQAEWVPITVAIPQARDDTTDPDHDLVFFGNLAYPPNIGAINRLSRIWPRITAERPGTTMLVAGRHASSAIRAEASVQGWGLRPDFPDVNELLATARLGVVPLDHASGIQIKVLEAAAFGLPQVLSPAARAGLDPDFPARVAPDDAAFVREIVTLLDDEPQRSQLGATARAHMEGLYTSERWVEWAIGVLSP